METEKALQNAIQEVAQAKVAEALGGDVLGKLVGAVMDHRDSYHNRDSKTAFERIVDNEIHNLLIQTVRKYIDENRTAIMGQVETCLAKRVKMTAGTIVDAFINEDWRADLTVKLNQGD